MDAKLPQNTPVKWASRISLSEPTRKMLLNALSRDSVQGVAYENAQRTLERLCGIYNGDGVLVEGPSFINTETMLYNVRKVAGSLAACAAKSTDENRQLYREKYPDYNMSIVAGLNACSTTTAQACEVIKELEDAVLQATGQPLVKNTVAVSSPPIVDLGKVISAIHKFSQLDTDHLSITRPGKTLIVTVDDGRKAGQTVSNRILNPLKTELKKWFDDHREALGEGAQFIEGDCPAIHLPNAPEKLAQYLGMHGQFVVGGKRWSLQHTQRDPEPFKNRGAVKG